MAAVSLAAKINTTTPCSPVAEKEQRKRSRGRTRKPTLYIYVYSNVYIEATCHRSSVQKSGAIALLIKFVNRFPFYCWAVALGWSPRYSWRRQLRSTAPYWLSFVFFSYILPLKNILFFWNQQPGALLTAILSGYMRPTDIYQTEGRSASFVLGVWQQTSINTIKVGKQRYSTYLIKGHNVMPWRCGRGRMATGGWWRMPDGGWRMADTNGRPVRRRCVPDVASLVSLLHTVGSQEPVRQSQCHSVPEKSRKCKANAWILLLHFVDFVLRFLLYF